MPEMHVRLRWPDGTVQRIYSPSLVIADHLEAGAAYPVAEVRDRLARALQEASDRVQAAYGFACPRAAASRAQVVDRAEAFPAGATVFVEAFEQ